MGDVRENLKECSLPAALEAMGRNPEAEGLVRTYMFLGFALVESLFIFALVFGLLIGFGIL